MTSESRTENGATLTSSYIYDALGQLTSFTRSDGQSESYTYDPVGNMTAKTQNGVSTTMKYNAANQLISSISGTNKTTYTYDANGNLVKSENAGGARSYTYNALNLLQSFTREDGYSETYSYNANRLLSTIKTSEDLTTTLTWDILYGDGVVISAAQNGETTNYTYGLERISAKTGSTRTEYVYDGRGSVAAEVSYNNAWYTFGGGLARKNVVSKSYSPFGELLTEQTSGFGYNGEYYNAATGMIYLRARFYEPEMNRFGQKDLLRGSAFAPQSLNRYLYVQNDPMNLIDTSGMSLKSLWEKGKNAVSNAFQAFVSNPVGTIVNTGRTVIDAVTHPVTTAKNIVTTTGKIITELFAPDPKPQTNTPTASPSGNRETSYDTYKSDSGHDRDRQTAKDTILSSNEQGDPSSVTQGVNQLSSKSPSMQDITNTPAACSFWEMMAQGEMARVQQQQLEAAAMADAFLGAINTVGRNGIDLLNAIVDAENALNRRLSIPLRINRINESVKQNLEQLTRRLASNDVSYDVGQLGGDVATTIIEYVGLIKAAKGLTGVLKKAPEILSSLSSFGRILLPAGGPPLESAIAVAGTATEAGTFAEGLVLFGDILFNYSAFKNDWNTLKSDANSHVTSEEGTPDYVRDNRVPQDRETVLSGDDYQRTNYRNKGAQVYEKDGRYYCRDTFHKGESAHLEVFDRFGRHLGEADPLTGELIPGTADPSKILNLR